MNNIRLQDVDPRILMSHFEEQIRVRRQNLQLEGMQGIQDIQLLDVADRPTYLMCLAAIKAFESLHGRLGINTLADMAKHIRLVELLSVTQSEVLPGELRTFSLDLLRSMRDSQAIAA